MVIRFIAPECGDNIEALEAVAASADAAAGTELSVIEFTTALVAALATLLASTFANETTGMLALGEFALGEFASGEFALGEFASGELALGELALGEFALGEFALGELALGEFALGELALGEFALGEFALGELAAKAEPTGNENASTNAIITIAMLFFMVPTPQYKNA